MRPQFYMALPGTVSADDLKSPLEEPKQIAPHAALSAWRAWNIPRRTSDKRRRNGKMLQSPHACRKLWQLPHKRAHIHRKVDMHISNRAQAVASSESRSARNRVLS